MTLFSVRGSIVVSIPACHAGNRGSIPRRGVIFFFFLVLFFMPLFFAAIETTSVLFCTLLTYVYIV